MRKNLALLSLLLALAVVVRYGSSQDLPGASKPLTKEQALTLQSLNAEHKAALAEAESARLRQENLQLRYILAITTYRTELGLDATWDYMEAEKAFKKRIDETKSTPKPSTPETSTTPSSPKKS